MKTSISVAKKKGATTKTRINSFPIVAIGASAGGLEAVSALFRNLTNDTGMAYIFVQHLSPNHKSLLTALLAKTTKMKVQQIDDMELIKPDNIYVIPYNKGIEVTDGHIKLLPRPKGSSIISIDVLFSSLAQTHKKNVIGIILSGNASDGTKGLKAIKKAGGITFAQDDTAKYKSMPTSAINEGVVDYILSPEEIAGELIRISHKSAKKTTELIKSTPDVIQDSDPNLTAIFEILHKRNGVDFSYYKQSTIKRRIQRRVVKNNTKTIKEYAKLLSKNKNEVESLYADLLINVTSFFRDTETFRYLKTTLLPKILKDKKKGETLRIWVPACSTGQEAYSIAMMIAELQEKQASKIPVQIFATDLSEHAIKGARLGEYTKGDLKSVSAGRIEHFFAKVNHKYRISQHLRDMCVFGTSHNILRDPPFSRMDFISCRNLLIYFDTDAQKKVLGTLYFSLNEKGYLMLGKSESTGTASQLFTQVNNKFKIYSQKKNVGVRKLPVLMPRFPKINIPEKNTRPVLQKNERVDSTVLDRLVDSVLLSNYMPACAIINKDMEILQFRGSTSLFLTHQPGKATLNILKMTRPELSFELRNAIQTALVTKKTISKTGIEIKIEAVFRMMSLEVRPIKTDRNEPLLLIVFTLQEQEINYQETGKNGKTSSAHKDHRIEKLTEKLNNAGAAIHSMTELHETAYEKLQAANEEIVSSNEEFQTLNEELESSKEEIEAANEELISTNRELKRHNALLEESYDYSQTIIATMHEPMIILDSNLHVKSANKSFYKKFSVTKEETEEMPFFELGNKQWDIPKLHELLKNILSKNSKFENFEVTHVFPGMGEKVMLLNASRLVQKTHRKKLIMLAIEDITERVVRQRIATGKNEEDVRIFNEVKKELEHAVKERTKELEEKNYELESANKKLIFQNAEKEKRAAELGVANIELAFQNKEKEKRASELGIANAELAFQNDEKEKRATELSIANQDLLSFTYISSHDLQEPLRKIQIFASCILKDDDKNLSESGKGYLKRMRDTANRMQKLIEALLAYSRTKNDDHSFETIDLNIIAEEIKKDFDVVIRQKQAVIEAGNLCSATVIPFQFHQLLHNLVSNALKFAGPDVPPHIVIESKITTGGKTGNKKLSALKRYCHLSVTDNGIGFELQYKDRIFEVFQRLHSIEKYVGTGIGLAICKRIVENHKGIITATGKLNEGARFDIYIPAE